MGCAFFANGQCEIYEDRPIDCRLFPVDIREERDGTLVWIVYTRLCPAGFDRTGLLEHAERLLPALQGHAREYARVDTRGMDAEPFDVLLKRFSNRPSVGRSWYLRIPMQEDRCVPIRWICESGRSSTAMPG